MSQNLNSAVAVIGIDIGKNSFHVVGLNDRGAIVLHGQRGDRVKVGPQDSGQSTCRPKDPLPQSNASTNRCMATYVVRRVLGTVTSELLILFLACVLSEASPEGTR
jgi:hypothetical protein